MFHLTTCPTCQTKFSIPEAAVGTRQICPHCQSPFLAGKSVAVGVADVPMKSAPVGAMAAAGAGYNKTLLGEQAPPIHYNCPRCKKPLEAPTSEAGVKKPCPYCGQRLQVPAAPSVGAAGDPNLNKTLLASDESLAPPPPINYNCPNCKRPLQSPASEAGTKKPCPYCSQRLQVPAAKPAAAAQPNLNKTLLASDESNGLPFGSVTGQPGPVHTASGSAVTIPGAPAPAGRSLLGPLSRMPKKMRTAGIVAGSILLLLFLFFLITAPGASNARKEHDKAQEELDNLKKEIEQKQLLLQQAQMLAANQNSQLENMRKEFDRQQDILNKQFELKLLKIQNDKLAEAELKAKREEELNKIAKAKEEADLKFKQQQDEFKAKMDLLQAQLLQANNKSNVIIHQPPPPYYYRWHPLYGPWW